MLNRRPHLTSDTGSGNGDENEDPLTVDENVDPVTDELLHSELGTKSRAFSSILYKYQATTLEARKKIGRAHV